MVGRAIVMGAAAALIGAPAAGAVTPVTCGTLATSMNSAAAGDVLQLPAGICHVNASITNANAFTLEGADGGTTLMPSLAGPIISAGDGSPVHFTLTGLTFTGAVGPAVLLQDPGEAATFTGDTFTSNTYASSFGGAISIQTQFNPGTLATQPTVITGNTFSGNHASGGGAVALLGSNPVTISGNTFTGNAAAAEGGALDIAGPSATANAIRITGNTFGGSAPADADTSTWPGSWSPRSSTSATERFCWAAATSTSGLATAPA
jgi:hypothetical protein